MVKFIFLKKLFQVKFPDDFFPYCFFWISPDNPVHQLAMRKEHDGGYCGNVKLHGEEPVVFGVTLTERNFPGKFL